jgi:DNA-binding SARP family transcriptional activator
MALGSKKARQLLRELALARGRPISADSIAEALWRDERRGGVRPADVGRDPG